jgi:hypothetical protein
MGLSSNSDDGSRKPTFSNDVLRLEISGPEQEHLSVIDVPGIFKSTTEGVTIKADIQLVRNMVKGYMDNPRSVMLAVVPASIDLATQEILEKHCTPKRWYRLLVPGMNCHSSANSISSSA